MTIRKKAVDQKFSFNPPDLTPLRNVIFAAIAALLGVGALLGLSGKMKAAT